MIDIFESLSQFLPEPGDGYVDITLPVVIDVDNSLLPLRIFPKEDHYTIYCPEDLFSELNGTQRRYYNIFMKKCDHAHYYHMQIDENDLVYKEFENDYSMVCAINQFVRFYIMFDDFIIRNNVIGQEENFES